MNDRFSAQLRQHLLAVANERLSEGQLAALEAGVAGTAQRHPLVAQFTRFSGRIGPFSSAAVRVGLIAALVAAAGVSVLVIGSRQSPPAEVLPTQTPAPTAAAATASSAPLATAGPSASAPACLLFDHEATYTGHAGTLPVSVTVPATASSPWFGGEDGFELVNASCDGTGTVRFNALLVGHVYKDSCSWKSSSVDVPTVSRAVSRLQAQQGHDTAGPSDTTIGPFRATRLDFSVPAGFDVAACDDGLLRLAGGGPNRDESVIAPGTTVQMYVAEVDGTTLVVTVGYRTEDATPDLLAEIDAILASLRVDM